MDNREFCGSELPMRSLSQVEQLLYQFVPRGVEQTFPGVIGLERAKYLLGAIDNPQDKINVIHIAGTSGKGSVATLTSAILHKLGFKVGLHVSPHLLDIRERTQINNTLISKAKFVDYLNQIIPAITEISESRFGKPTYFEVTTGLAFYVFWRENVDYAVIETGLGGLYDGTNTISREDKFVILTRIGKDHTRILGNTLKEIAVQKAEIIQRGNTVIALRQRPQVNQVFEDIANKRNARLSYMNKKKNIKNIRVSPEKTVFNLDFEGTRLRDLEVRLLGTHQAENSCLALGALMLLSKRDGFIVDEQAIRDALSTAHFPGRLEVLNVRKKKVVVDGAHNPQKIASLTSSLRRMFPERKFYFLIAFKSDKDVLNSLKYIVPLADGIIITSFFSANQDLVHLSAEPEEVAGYLRKLGFEDFKTIEDPKEAMEATLAEDGRYLVVTGSLYLLGEVYPLLLH